MGQQPLDIAQAVALILATERDGLAATACPAGSPDAVDVRLGLVGQIVHVVRRPTRENLS